MRSSPRLGIAILGWALGLVYGICAADAIGLPWRLLLAVLAIALIYPAWKRVLCGRGPAAVRHLHWQRDGTWTVTLAGGVVEHGCTLDPSSSAAGPFLWLALQGRALHRIVLDRRFQEPASFAALRRRLQVERGTLR